MSFKDDWNEANKKEKRTWIIQIVFVVIFGTIGITLAIQFGVASAKGYRLYSLLIPIALTQIINFIIIKIPWKEAPTNKTGSEDK